tara:strand:- start:223 stop:600 length:378 start_codon:yes stop_codon:yes gene_type:complete
MKKPDNIVFNSKTKEYDSFKKEYPTSFNSKNFAPERISRLKIDSQPYFKERLLEIKKQYYSLTKELEWNELIYQSKYTFKPIIGKSYYLYENEKNNFLSIIRPEEWSHKCIGEFKLRANNIWEKI